MATLGQVLVSVGADVKPFEASMQKVEQATGKIANQMKQTGDKIEKTMKEATEGTSNGFTEASETVQKFNKNMKRTATQTAKNFSNLPAHLKPFANSIEESRKEFQKMNQTSSLSLQELQKNILKTRVGMDKMTSVSKSGKDAIKMIQQMGEETKKTRLAVLGFNEDASLAIDSKQSVLQLKKFESYVQSTKRELEKLRDAGDMGSYTAGMKELERQMREVDDAMKATAKGGDAYINQLERLGVVTESVGNRAAMAMERQRESFMRSLDAMNARATQSEKMIKNLDRLKTRKLDQQFLKVSHSLEEMAKRGNVAAVALKEAGKGASMKEVNEQIQLINRGLVRMQALQMAMPLIIAGITFALVKASKGANVAEVRKQQAEITQIYKDAVDERAKAIYEFAGLFEKATLVKTDKETLTKNLNEQVKILVDWRNNLKVLAKRGVEEGLLDELEQMGASANGEIKQLTKMTDVELNNYVKLWKEKHRLAREQAISELEGLRQETAKKIAELEETLKPLGISLEKAKAEWATALQPFIESWGYAASKIVDAFTAMGQMVNKVNEFNPEITKAIGNILYMATVLTLILSPLAIGVSRTGSFALAFTDLWRRIAPLTTGLLSIAGTVLIVATAIYVGIQALTNMWKHSEAFRNALTGIWNSVKTAFLTAFAPLKTELQLLGGFFKMIMMQIFGDTSNVSNIWQVLGDKVAAIINFIAPLITSVLSFAFQYVVSIAVPAIQTIISVLRDIYVIVQTVIPYIKAIFSAVFPVVSKVVKIAFMIIAGTVIATLTNIKNIVIASLNIIKNIFNLFKNILTGNWKGAWENIKAILKNALLLVWNLVQMYFIGRILGIFRTFVGKAGGVVKGITEKITSPFKKAWEGAKGWIDKIKNGFLNMFTGKIKTPKFSFSGSMNPAEWVKGNTPKLKVNWNATGNVFNGASILGGNQGVGEAGAEAVMPITRKRYFAPWASMVSDLLADNLNYGTEGAGGGVINKFEIAQLIVREEADINRIAEALEKKQRQQNRARGVLE